MDPTTDATYRSLRPVATAAMQNEFAVCRLFPPGMLQGVRCYPAMRQSLKRSTKHLKPSNYMSWYDL